MMKKFRLCTCLLTFRATQWSCGIIFILTMLYSKSYFENSVDPIGPDKQIFKCKIVFIFLAISLNMCCGYSKELSHWSGSKLFDTLVVCWRKKISCIQRVRYGTIIKCKGIIKAILENSKTDQWLMFVATLYFSSKWLQWLMVGWTMNETALAGEKLTLKAPPIICSRRQLKILPRFQK